MQESFLITESLRGHLLSKLLWIHQFLYRAICSYVVKLLHFSFLRGVIVSLSNKDSCFFPVLNIISPYQCYYTFYFFYYSLETNQLLVILSSVLLCSNGLEQALFFFSPLWFKWQSIWKHSSALIQTCSVFGLQVNVSFNVFDPLAIPGYSWLIWGTEKYVNMHLLSVCPEVQMFCISVWSILLFLTSFTRNNEMDSSQIVLGSPTGSTFVFNAKLIHIIIFMSVWKQRAS